MAKSKWESQLEAELETESGSKSDSSSVTLPLAIFISIAIYCFGLFVGLLEAVVVAAVAVVVAALAWSCLFFSLSILNFYHIFGYAAGQTGCRNRRLCRCCHSNVQRKWCGRCSTLDCCCLSCLYPFLARFMPFDKSNKHTPATP